MLEPTFPERMRHITVEENSRIIISSVASYYGYCVKGGALQVGSSSTRAVVNSSVLILFFDVLLTNLMLT